MNDEQEYQDPDDIFRDIDLDNEDDVAEENTRLIKKVFAIDRKTNEKYRVEHSRTAQKGIL